MQNAILFMIMLGLLCVIWGAAFMGWFIKFQIDRGRLPKALKDRKDRLIQLLDEN